MQYMGRYKPPVHRAGPCARRKNLLYYHSLAEGTRSPPEETRRAFCFFGKRRARPVGKTGGQGQARYPQGLLQAEG